MHFLKIKQICIKILRFKFLEEIPEKENLVLVLMNAFLWGLKFRLLYNMLYLCRSKKKKLKKDKNQCYLQLYSTVSKFNEKNKGKKILNLKI